MSLLTVGPANMFVFESWFSWVDALRLCLDFRFVGSLMDMGIDISLGILFTSPHSFCFLSTNPRSKHCL